MPRSVRRQLIEQCRQVQEHIDRLDYILVDMKDRSMGRQPAIDKYAPAIVQANDLLRDLWQALRSEL